MSIRTLTERSAEVYDRLKGPIVPLNLCFDESREVDMVTMRKYVNWLCEQQVPVLLLTYGSSEFMWLTDDWIRRLTAELAEEIDGRSLFVASTNWCPPGDCRNFLEFADRAGVDAVKVQTNPWMVSTAGLPPREAILGYFDCIAGAAEIPLILWGHAIAPYPVEVVLELAGRTEIVGMKNDDDQFNYYYEICRATANEQFAVFSGGLMRNFYFGYPAGSPAYLCPIAPFLPALALEFYEHMVSGRTSEAWQMVLRYEDRWLREAVRLGWIQSLRTAFQAYGLFPNNRHYLPQLTHTESQVQEVRESLREIFGPIDPVEYSSDP